MSGGQLKGPRRTPPTVETILDDLTELQDVILIRTLGNLTKDSLVWLNYQQILERRAMAEIVAKTIAEVG